MKNINRDSGQLLYKQVENFILKKIEQDIYKPEDVIPTERKLCEILGVSRHTVRRAIQNLVEKGYLYRVQGAGTFVFDKKLLENKKNNTVGVILNNCSVELDSKILNGIEKAIQDEKFRINFVNNKNNYKKEAELIQQMRNEGVEGLIIMPAEDQRRNSAIFDLKAAGFPFVIVDKRLQNCKTNCVMSDNINGGYKATEYLIKLKHQKIAFVKNEYSKTSSINDRMMGYRNALNDYDISYNSKYVFSYNQNNPLKKIKEDIYKFIKKTKVTAVFALNDYIATDIIKMCREKDINIPRDLSLIGFDDLNFVKHLEVPLTTVAQFPRDIGFTAAKLLIKKIEEYSNSSNNNKILTKEIYYPIELRKRSSCLKLN